MTSQPDIQVLVVDDYENQYIYIKDILSTIVQTVYHVDWASTYEAGLVGISSGVYDVCLVDYDLGDHNGIELVHFAVQNGHRTPMILLTGRGSHEIDMEAMRAGAADYLDKANLKLAALERSIRYAVERANAMNALRESESRRRRLMEMVSAGIYILQDHHFAYVNPAFEHIIGYSLADLQQVDIGLFSPLFSPHLDLLSDESVEGDAPIKRREEVHLATKFNSSIWLDVTTSIIDMDGEPALLGTIVDITDRKRAEAIEHQQRVFAEALLDIATVLNQSLDFNDVLSRILGSVERVVPHDTANIMLIDDDELAYVVEHQGYGTMDVGAEIETVTFHIPDTPSLSYMLQSRQPYIVEDVMTDQNWLRDVTDFNIRAYIGVPVLIKGEVIGYLNLDSRVPGFFTETHADRLKIFAELAAIAIRNAQMFEQAQAQAAVEERQRLARDLHDAVSQTLFSANMIAETLPRLFERNPDDAIGGITKLSQLTKGALAEMRTLLLELRPASFEQSSLRSLLDHLANAFTGRTQVPVVVHGAEQAALPPDVKIVFYRIAQESLNNIMKHARASKVEILLEVTTDAVMLRVRDDGRGFEPRSVTDEHMGLSIMQERAATIHAICHIDSRLDEGTEVVLTWKGIA